MKYTAGILLITFTLFGCVTAPIDPNLASQDPEEAKKDNAEHIPDIETAITRFSITLKQKHVKNNALKTLQSNHR